ncbi:MAG: hypothetical protein B7C24_18250 [Bacteroidetes bacterium 4572_77]|nr:MAG: hypothetical protein B7C24_18250 [Bacteroidetes bacterium 4572_77]
MKTMKSIVMTALIIIAATSIAFAENATIKTNATSHKTSKTIIEKACTDLDGVSKAKFDMKTRSITVKYNAKATNINKIKKAITEVGFMADCMPANQKAAKLLPKECQAPSCSHTKTSSCCPPKAKTKSCCPSKAKTK